MYDSGSTCLLLKRRVSDRLELEGEDVELKIALAGGQESRSSEKLVEIQIASIKGDYITPKLIATTSKIIISPLPPVTIDPKRYPHLAGIDFTENYPQTCCSDVEILLDANLTVAHMLSIRQAPVSLLGPKAIKTKLGWILCGQEEQDDDNRQIVSTKIIRSNGDEEEHEMFRRFFSIEDLGLKNEHETTYTQEEVQALELMDSGAEYSADERRFTVPLLFKLPPEKYLESHYPVCYKIAKTSRAKAIRDGMIEAVDKAMNVLLEIGAAELIPPGELRNKQSSYIPMTPIYKFHSETTKVRLCLNCSSKHKVSKKSLNDIMYAGCVSQWMPCMVSLLLKFRLYPVAILSDIKSMFFEIRVAKRFRDWTRFLYAWGSDPEPKSYRFTSLIMGAVSSPFQSLYCIKKLCQMFQDEFPEVAEAVEQTIYIDDLIFPCNDKEQAARVARQMVQMFSKASMTIHKFRATSEDILDMAEIPETSRAKNPIHKVMGVQWDPLRDTIKYDFTDSIDKVETESKRSMLRQISKIWDPCGSYLTPVIFKGKILVKRAWELELSWDEPISGELLKDYLLWKQSITELETIEVPRLLLPSIERGKAWLAVSSDASIQGVGICCHIISGNKSELLYSKSRVAPIKSLKNKENSCSIVRLELISILLACRCVAYLKSVLGENFFSKIHYFSDSMINILRIRRGNPASFKVWTASRLLEIQSRMGPHSIHKIPGVLNASDYASRGTLVPEIKDCKLWRSGPAFYLLPQNHWPPEKSLTKEEGAEIERLNLLESKAKHVVEATAAAARYIFKSHLPFGLIMEKYSDFGKMSRVLAFLFRFLTAKCPALKEKTKIFKNAEIGQKGSLTVKEIKTATSFLIRAEQRRIFQQELEVEGKGDLVPKENSPLAQMGVFQDDLGLLRVTTRLDRSKTIPEYTRRPILLPKNCDLVHKYLLYLHRINNHLQISNLFFYIQRNFFLQGGRRELQICLRKCRHLKCQRPRKLDCPPPSLPESRCDGQEAFVHISLDFFGPVYYRPEEKTCDCPEEPKKGYGLLISCMYCRGVHLQLVRSQSTEDFLYAFLTYTSIRGTPASVYSDNSKTLKMAQKELNRIYRSIDWEKVKDETAQKSIEWIFSVSKYPASNGVTEIMVKAAKTALNCTLMSTGNLKFAHLESIISLAMLDINDRVLYSKSEFYPNSDMVTPSQLIAGRLLKPIPHDTKTKVAEAPFSRMMLHRRLLSVKFFKSWYKTYTLGLQGLKFAKKNQDPPISIGQVVMYRDENSIKPKYKLGKIIQMKRSGDSQIRRIVLQIASGSKIERHIKAISILEADVPKKQTN